VTDSAEPTTPPAAENPVEEAINDDAKSSARGKLGWLSITIAALFGLFYAYSLFTAISHAFEVSTIFIEGSASTDSVPWALVVVGILLPIVIFALAFLIGLRRNVFAKALIFVVGLAALSALALTILGFEALILAANAVVPV